MSEHEYVPKSKAGKWFNDRLPLLTLGAHLTDYPTPKNLNYWWTFGGILTFCLIILFQKVFKSHSIKDYLKPF